MDGPAMRISPAKRDFIILTQSPFMRNGWPITGMNNNPTGYCLLSFHLMVGAMNGVTGRIGPARLPLSPGIFICFMAIQQCCPRVTTILKDMLITSMIYILPASLHGAWAIGYQ